MSNQIHDCSFDGSLRAVLTKGIEELDNKTQSFIKWETEYFWNNYKDEDFSAADLYEHRLQLAILMEEFNDLLDKFKTAADNSPKIFEIFKITTKLSLKLTTIIGKLYTSWYTLHYEFNKEEREKFNKILDFVPTKPINE